MRTKICESLMRTGTKTLAGFLKKQRFFPLMARHLLSGAGGENRVVDMTLSTIQFQVRLYINPQKEHWIIEFSGKFDWKIIRKQNDLQRNL